MRTAALLALLLPVLFGCAPRAHPDAPAPEEFRSMSRYLELKNSGHRPRSVLINTAGGGASDRTLAPGDVLRLAFPLNTNFIFHFPGEGSVSESNPGKTTPLVVHCDLNDTPAGFGLSWSGGSSSPSTEAVSAAFNNTRLVVDVQPRK